MDRYGLIGFPLGHSFSKNYFNEKFANEHIDAEYINYEIPDIRILKEILASTPDLKGLNVTIPYKKKVIKYLGAISPEAKTIGAVNVIRVRHNGKKTLLKGFNSDVIGFTRSIAPLIESFHKKLILGTGGASKAINYGLKSLGLETLFVSRNKRKDSSLTTRLPRTPSTSITLLSTVRRWECIPMPTNVHGCPYEAMDNHNLLYDLLYNPDETLFMKGAAAGAVTKNGLEMLLLQAFASWEFWNGQEQK